MMHEMLKRNLWEFQVEIDETETTEWYSTKEPWRCECGDCRNFLELSNRNELPEAVHAISERTKYCIRKSHLCMRDQSMVVDWGEVRCCHEIYPYRAPGFPTPHFDLKFWVTLSWGVR